MKSIFIAIFLIYSSISFGAEKANSPIKVKWVLAHEPIDLFKIAADSFTKEVTAKTNGGVVFEVMSLPEYEAKYNHKKKIPYTRFVSKIQNNDIEMSQTYTTDLGRLSNPMYALDLPFLFRDHAHAQKVLEGKVGEELLAGLSSKNIRGLAFTYSGGYRIIPGVKKITTVEDFKGLKIRTSLSPVARDTFETLGATTFAMSLDDIDQGIRSGKINQAESTYARYFPMGQNKVANIVNETNHSLFLTSIIMNEKFWQSLPENYRVIMKEAAINAARLERDHSVKVGLETREECLKSGVEIYTLDKAEQEKMKIALAPVYKKFSPMIGKELIAEIQAQ